MPAREAISVVVPARDAVASLPACLAALARQSLPRSGFEVIVVDDGSRDGTAAAAAASGADRVLQSGGRGAAAARNAGLAAAAGTVILFTDADCEPEPGWVAALSAPLLAGSADGVKGTYLTRQTEPVARFVQHEYEEKYRRLARRRWIDFIDTYSAGFRRPVLEALGGYDEGFPGASVEDQELSFRAARAGYRLLFVPEARVVHRHAASLAAYARKKYRIGYWKVRVLRAHPAKLAGDSHTPQSLKAQMVLAPLALAAAAAAPLAPPAGWLAVAAAGLFLALAAPLTLQIARRDPALALRAPGYLAVRSLALAAGLAAGLFRRGA